MSDLERYQNMMLDRVYGLLEPEQAAELDAFLASGPEGDALRLQAEEWKRQLGMAAKAAFPQIQFAVPTAKSAPRPLPQKSRPQRERTRSSPKQDSARSWAPWVVAASVIAVLVGFGAPVLREAVSEMDAAKDARARLAAFETADKAYQREVAQYSGREEAAARDERLAAQLHGELEENFANALAQARKAVEDKQFIVRLSGPDRAQPGAPNQWHVNMYKRSGVQALPGKVDWLVKDQTGQIVYSDSKQAATRQGFREPPTIELPVSFWEKVKPNSELTLEVIAYEDNLKSKVNARVPLAQPIFVTHLATDKPLYKPGETVYFRSLTLDRATFTPPEKDMTLEFRITEPGGQPKPILVDGVPARGSARGFTDVNQPARELPGPDKKPVRGIGCGQFDIPAAAPGGEYAISVVDVSPTFDELQKQFRDREVVLETRKFNVIEYKPENILKTLEFDGKSYGAGDVVLVKCTATPVQGGKRKLPVRVAAQVDGRPIVVQHPAQTDDDGVVRLKFTLPAAITKGNGTIDVTFPDGSDADVISRPIPIVGRIINVEFFPESGDLIEGVPNRVYFEATTPAGKPADLKGIITDGLETVAEVATLTDPDHPGVNRGQGVFTFTPKPGHSYFLKVSKPTGIIEPVIKNSLSPRSVAGGIGLSNLAFGAGSLVHSIATGFELPRAKADGVALTALDPVTSPIEPLRVQLQIGNGKKSLLVGAYARGNLVDHRHVEIEAGTPVEVELKPNNNKGGVTRITVFEEKIGMDGKPAQVIPVAERLVYRKPAQQLLLNVRPDRARYNPGSQVGLDIAAFNENEKAVPAIVMVAVVNQNVLTMADEKTGRLMPTHFLLASEVKKPDDLEHADFLLGESTQAAAALDLLLGTQGWRRFAEQNAASPRQKQPEVERLLVANGQKAQAPVETLHQELEKVYTEYRPKFETSLVRLTTAMETLAAVQDEIQNNRERTRQLERSRAEAGISYQQALTRLKDREEEGSEHRSLLLARLCVGLLLIAGLCIGLGVIRQSAGVGYFATAAGCFALCAVALLGTSLAGREAGTSREVAFQAPRMPKPEAFNHFGEAQEGATAAPPAEGAAFDKPQDPAADAQRAERRDRGENKLLEADKFRQPLMKAEKAMMPPAAAAMLRAGKPDAAFGMDPADGKVKGGGGNLMLARDKDLAANRKPGFDNRNGLRGALKDGEAQQQFNKFDQLAGANRFEKLKKARIQGLLQLEVGKQFLGAKDEARFNQPVVPGAPPATAPGIANLDYEQLLLQAEQIPGFFVREYKFQKIARPNEPETRDDFTETVYWQPVLVMPESGRADVHFQLSDSIARYQVLVAGHTVDGRIGATLTHIEARKPFTVDPKVPIEITAGDRIDVPIRVVNDSDIRRTVSFGITPDGLAPLNPDLKLQQGAYRDAIELLANEKGRKIVTFRSTKKEGNVSLSVVGSSDPIETPDQILRTFRVVPDGFPASGAVSDLLEKKANATLMLPEMIKGTLKVQVNVYPTTLADLQNGLESLMREPGGCFEQTSTSNYPNLLILDYLKSSDQVKPELAQRAKGMLDRGYAKLVAFECPDSSDNKNRHGFEWFGQMDQQHQALTAYGLLQFKDLARAYPGKVDPELIKRTQQYLLGQQNANKEGFKRNARALDSFGRAPAHITDAYIVWALTESDPDDKEGMTDLLKQLDYLKKLAMENADAKKDPYFLALVANALLHRPVNGNRDEAIALLARIADNHLKTGYVDGAATSITCSGGRDLQIETTALAVLGWLRSGEPTKFVKPIKETTKWIGQQRGGYGGFGSTQSTILALKALIEHTKASRKPAEAGEVRLTVNGQTFKKAFTEKDQEVITLDIERPEELFKEGANEATIEITTQQAYPFSLAWSCSTSTPLSSDKCSVEFATKLDRENALEGDTVRVNVSLTNKTDKAHGMAVAIVGLPGGCRLPADLKELTKLREENQISFFEIRGRELVLYWRALKSNETIELSFNAICDVPGQYAGPASRGYLYYNADHKHWVKPLNVTITPANQTSDAGVAVK